SEAMEVEGRMHHQQQLLSTHPAKDHSWLRVRWGEKKLEQLGACVHRLVFSADGEVSEVWLRAGKGHDREKANNLSKKLLNEFGSVATWSVHAIKTVDALRHVHVLPPQNRVKFAPLKRDHQVYQDYPDCTPEMNAESRGAVWLSAKLSATKGNIKVVNEREEPVNQNSAESFESTGIHRCRLFSSALGLMMLRDGKPRKGGLEAWIGSSFFQNLLKTRHPAFEVSDGKFRPAESPDGFEFCCANGENLAKILKILKKPEFTEKWLGALERAVLEERYGLSLCEKGFLAVDDPSRRMFMELTPYNGKPAPLSDRIPMRGKEFLEKKHHGKHVGHDIYDQFDKAWKTACLSSINDHQHPEDWVVELKWEKEGAGGDRPGNKDGRLITDAGLGRPIDLAESSAHSKGSRPEKKQDLFRILCIKVATATDLLYTTKRDKTYFSYDLGWLLHDTRNCLAHNSAGCSALGIVSLWAELIADGDLNRFAHFLAQQAREMQDIVPEYVKANEARS
ncbi:MAG: hypothetical protein SGPRY_012105, partial [Prymnesium sp.]